jgi:hypothetical protein
MIDPLKYAHLHVRDYRVMRGFSYINIQGWELIEFATSWRTGSDPEERHLWVITTSQTISNAGFRIARTK